MKLLGTWPANLALHLEDDSRVQTPINGPQQELRLHLPRPLLSL